MSLGEIVLLLLVGIIVVGPRNLPTMMRTAGQWVARLRRMSTELRSQSGIDDLLRSEGLDEHLHQLRSLTRLNVVDTLMSPAAPAAHRALSAPAASPASATPGAARPRAVYPSAQSLEWKRDEPLREREYPLVGCDAGGARPDDAAPYHPAEPVEAAPVEPATQATATPPDVAPAAPTAPATPVPATEPAVIEAPT